MSVFQILLLVLIFVAASLAAYGVLVLFSPRPTEERLRQMAGADQSALRGGEAPWKARILEAAAPLSKLALPEEGWENSQLRVRFLQAGYRSSLAPKAFFAAKALLTFALPILLLTYLGLSRPKFEATGLTAFLLLLAAIGYYLPNAVIARRIRLRQREIFEALPDALDLLVVCVEAGLALDAALARVGEEVGTRSRILAEELHLANLELRAGAGRERALRNLAQRTGVPEVDSLTAMLVQADRFGTSVADSLRVQAEMMRTRRRQRAEEQAAKIAVKLLFPVIFCIFPSLLLVLMGPAMIRVFRILLPTMAGQ